MGDRGNIVTVSKSAGKICFYTHWDGYKLQSVVARALDRARDRWDDPPYLNRVIFSELTHGHEMDTTGYGISTGEIDSGELIELNHNDKTVRVNHGPTLSFEHMVRSWYQH